jgi:hypothetical protein
LLFLQKDFINQILLKFIKQIKMKKFVLLIISALFTLNVLAQDSGFGIGIIIGEPTGLSGKYWLSEKSAVDGGLAWSYLNEGAFHIHADILVHSYNLIHVSKGQLPLYLGLGARIKLASDTRIGARIPLGINYHFGSAPLDVFFEVVPILELIPATDFDINAAIGIRYFF